MPPTEPYVLPLFELCATACEDTIPPTEQNYYTGWALGFEWCCRLLIESPGLMNRVARAVITSSNDDAPGPPPTRIISSLLQMLPEATRRIEDARGYRLPEVEP